jgi:hypothetical protein
LGARISGETGEQERPSEKPEVTYTEVDPTTRTLKGADLTVGEESCWTQTSNVGRSVGPNMIDASD